MRLEPVADTSRPPDPSLPRDLISILEAATLCHVDYDTMLRWALKGALPYYEVGPANRRMVSRRDAERQIRKGQHED